MSPVLEEHLDYLSDSVRTDLYRRAVATAIRPGDCVVDVGCGFGPLGLMCLEAGAAHVYGIDHSAAIEFARETMRRAGLADRYTCIDASSFAAQLPERVDVVICDHVGYLGFDYGLLALMADAVRRFLKPGGRVIPMELTLGIAGVASAETASAAAAWTAPTMPSALAWIDAPHRNAKKARVLPASAFGTAPATLGTFDLARPTAPDHLRFTAEVEAQRDADLDGLGGWFSSHLAPGVVMTNSPFAADRIGRPNAYLPLTAPLAVRAGDRIRIDLSARPRDEVITWSAQNLRTGERRRQSTFNAAPLSANDLVPIEQRRPRLRDESRAAAIVMGYVDGARTRGDIVAAVAAEHPDVVPAGGSVAELVARVLRRHAQ
ncbi:methyltransferase domain-containing protein [Parablastomonas sp. CN1-191]|uniref:methyltransferase domain-containing protein n=1 Tax=Parablastomonas sp. CN1-191 TaxID=3400908 RepID=UPI003BF8D218